VHICSCSSTAAQWHGSFLFFSESKGDVYSPESSFSSSFLQLVMTSECYFNFMEPVKAPYTFMLHEKYSTWSVVDTHSMYILCIRMYTALTMVLYQTPIKRCMVKIKGKVYFKLHKAHFRPEFCKSHDG